MKSSPSTATVLILLVLLLVVAAGFVFLFQAELRFRDHLRTLSAENESLQATQAEAELELSAAVATRDAVAADLAAAESDSLTLEGQLVESQQALDALNAEVETLRGQLADVADQQQNEPPVARIVSPLEAEALPAGQPVQIVLVAGDAAGLSALMLDVNGRRFSTYTLDGEKLYARTLNWNAPAEEGEVVLTVTATNLNDVTSAPQSTTVTLVDTEARNATIRAEVEANVIAMRGLEPTTPITPTVLTRDALRQRLENDFAAEITPEESQADVLELSAFDFLAADFDLYAAQLALQSESIGGFYDPETAEFVVVSDGALLDPAAQWTHAHEFVHALQDQHYDLEALTDEALDSEARAAVRALAEGEAELVQSLYLFDNDFFTEEEIEAIRNNTGGEEQADLLNTVPPVLINDMIFPYTAGVDFVVELYREGGFAAIDAAWANPPRSTEHILHPDRYLAGDAPQIVALAPLTATLGAGWELVDEDIMGEFYLRQYLAQQLPASAVGRAAAGWGGDRYAVYHNAAAGALVMALRLVWDTPADAQEFAAAYADYPAALLGVVATPQPDGGNCWVADEVICLAQVESESFIVRAPDEATAAAVMAAIRGN
ncbi:protein of unknown function [Candidatus Promineifilum breve]|uniref:Uncharacterized protein n=1 Tax=Candidatus Promineifilum breve TaxID=1806508 RepID=A0A160T399_9CHLR|nr:hypothetical protein [Candidatus Promineifilum breve]CUS04466.2 protein of unknown function [Candidatus Promineifilum breve]